MISDCVGDRLWIWVCPGGVAVELGAHADMIVARGALNRTNRRVRARLEKASVDRGKWEVVISLYDDCLVTCGDRDAIPDC